MVDICRDTEGKYIRLEETVAVALKEKLFLIFASWKKCMQIRN